MIEDILIFFKQSTYKLNYYILFIEYLTLFVTVFFLKKYKIFSYYKFFTTYILLVVIAETLATLLIHLKHNFYIHDVFGYLEYVLIALIYYNLSKKKSHKKIIIYSIVSYSILTLFLFYDYDFRLYLIIIESVLIIYLVINYFVYLLNSKDILNYKKQLPFWLSVSFLLFFLSAIPFFSLQYSDLMKNRNLFPILHSLIFIYYGLFIYGLITCRRVNL